MAENTQKAQNSTIASTTSVANDAIAIFIWDQVPCSQRRPHTGPICKPQGPVTACGVNLT